jgi:hypothetical protein
LGKIFPASVRPIILEEALAVGAAANGRVSMQQVNLNLIYHVSKEESVNLS